MSDAEIVARALSTQIGPAPRRCFEDGDCREFAEIIVAALTEAGRLVPEWHVCIDAGRWERVRNAAWGWSEWVRLTNLNDVSTEDAVIAETLTEQLQPGDLDA